MEILIIIAILIACPIILGSIFEKQDKDKAKKNQQEITKQAQFNMSTHNYLEKHTSQCGWALVKLANCRFAYVNGLGQYLNNEIFSSAEDFHNNIAVVRKLNCGAGIIHSSGVYHIPCEARNNLETYITKVYEGLYQYKKVFYSKPSYVEHKEVYIVKEDGTYLNKEYASKLLEIRHNYIKLQYGLKIGEIDFDGKVLSRAFIKRVDLGDGYYKVCLAPESNKIWFYRTFILELKNCSDNTKAHVWKDGNTSITTSWPGIQMIYLGQTDNNYKRYWAFDIDTSRVDRIIANNNNGGKQTADLPIPTNSLNNTYYCENYTVDTGWYTFDVNTVLYD